MKLNNKYILLSFLLLCTLVVHAQVRKAPVYKNAAAPIEQRVQDLLGRMTLEEKLRQIDVWHPKADLSIAAVLQTLIKSLGDTVRNGIGFLQFNVFMSYKKYVGQFNAIQKYFMEQTRLGIPAIS